MAGSLLMLRWKECSGHDELCDTIQTCSTWIKKTVKALCQDSQCEC